MRNKLEEWLDVPAIMETCHGNIEGTLKYGIKLPLKPGTTPLKECKIASTESIGAHYWFVNENQSIKIRLIRYETHDDKITGVGSDGVSFNYTIRRIENGS